MESGANWPLCALNLPGSNLMKAKRIEKLVLMAQMEAAKSIKKGNPPFGNLCWSLYSTCSL